MTLIVNNNEKASLNKITIYTLDNNSGITISASDLNDDKFGNMIASNFIKFNGKSRLLVKNITNGIPTSVNVSIDSIPPGLYHGTIFLEGEYKTSIPITVATKPDLTRVSILLFLGIAISIVVWNGIAYWSLRKEHKLIKTRSKKIISRINKINNQTLANRIQLNSILITDSIKKIIEKLEYSTTDSAKDELEKVEGILPPELTTKNESTTNQNGEDSNRHQVISNLLGTGKSEELEKSIDGIIFHLETM